jgi:hypothetical protein
MVLTDTEIEEAKARDRAYRTTDGGVLYLYLVPTYGKLWRWKYASADSKS